MKSKYWVMILAVALILCAILSAVLLWPGETAARAEVWSDGVLVEMLDLAVDRVLTLQGKNGVNIVTVKDGKIAVTEADCPDHYCIQRGYCNSGAQIVCLPNRLVIKFLGQKTLDGIVG